MYKILKNYSLTEKRIIASGIIGNLIENFDVMLCSYLAPIMAAVFFSNGTLKNNLYYIFNIFFVGYISRPIGSLLLGLYADQIGRKKVQIYSIICVGISTASIGLIPGYQRIGILSTILFSLFRISQNIAVGGEYISSISYLIESANQKRKGFYGSWVSVGFNLGSLVASFCVVFLLYLVEKNIIPESGWRAIFLFALFGSTAGFWIRKSLPESKEFILENTSTEFLKKNIILKNTLSLIKRNPLRCMSIVSVTWLGVAQTSALFIYSPIHMTIYNHFSQYKALELNTLCLIFLIPLIPIFGFISDYYSKIKLLIIAALSFFVVSFPYFWYLSYGSYKQILITKLIFCIPSACFYAIAPVLIAEIFPVKVRCTSLAFIYQITASFAAGLTPMIMFYLANHSTNMPYSPVYYLMSSILLCLAGLCFLYNEKNVAKKESALDVSTDYSY